MEIGLYDVDSHNYPNLPLMKISAWHKAQGDNVEFILPIKHYDKIYVSKVFGDEYSTMPNFCLQADEIVYGGTGFAITVENGKEIYHKDLDPNLPYEIEHIYPDYSLYPELTKDTAFGFLTRGCCNNCDFCIVSKKEGMCSKKVADLSEFWRGQRNISLLDPNLLACKDRMDLLKQLADSKAYVDFTQGLDARFITEEVAHALSWSVMITLPILFASAWDPHWVVYLMLGVNLAIHAVVDDLKANKKKINLIIDQTVHFIQIVVTWCVWAVTA